MGRPLVEPGAIVRNPLVLIGCGLFVVTVIVYGQKWLFGSPRPPSPDELARQALTAAAPSEREVAALRLAAGGEAALPQMRRVLAESNSPHVRAAVSQGLGAAGDWESVPNLIALLSDPSELVRGRAGNAIVELLGADYFFRADDPLDKRNAAIRAIRQCYKVLQASPPPRNRGGER